MATTKDSCLFSALKTIKNEYNIVSMNVEKKIKRTSKKKSKQINLIYTIHCGKMNVEVNPLAYSQDDIEKIKYLVDGLSKNILIDKTYVKFKGNHFKDAFLVEDKWYEFNKLIIDTDFGRKSGKKINDMIRETLMAIALTYLYDCISKYDYDPSEIEISYIPKYRFRVEYEEDRRKNWFF